jgi:DNA repair protein RadD
MTQPASAPSAISLRDYQHALVAKIRAAMRRGNHRVVAVSPTGSGKTVVGAFIVASAVAKGGRVLFLAHRNEIVDQTCRTLHGFGLDVGCVAASSKWPSRPDAPVQVASIQTLVARETVRPVASLLMWDECHHASEAAATWTGLLDAYPTTPMVGLTATPERGDGGSLAPLFNDIVVGATVRELTTAGHLVPCEIVRPGRMLENGQIAQHPLAAYIEHGERRQGVLFARTVEEARAYAAEFTAAGHRCECITANTPQGDRDIAFELFRRGVVRILSNVFCLTEGVDLPMTAVCIMARGAGSAGQYIQMTGRALRPSPGKKSALLLDLRGVSHVHGMPEDERLFSLDGRGISLVQGARHCQVCQQPIEGYPCDSCGFAGGGGGDQAETTVVNEPLVRFARMIAQGPQQREETLRRWVARALDAGHKVTSVKYRWSAVYKEELSSARLMAAVADVNRIREGA